VKIRLGSEHDEKKLTSFCNMLEGEGVDLLSIHARFKHESFSRKPRWQAIAAIKERISIPVVVNGGIFTVTDANECLRLSNADGLMVGRGAVIRPWLFAEIARELCGNGHAVPDVSLPLLYRSFTDILNTHFRPEYRLARLKQFTHYFAQNYQFGHYLASRVQSSASVDEACGRAEEFFEKAEGIMKQPVRMYTPDLASSR